jgi:hypothetical protein
MKYKNNNQAEAMRGHIENCRASGQTVIRYCSEHHLAPSKYYYWQKRLQEAPAESGFTQLSPVTANAVTTTIHFPNGVHIAFGGSVSTSVLKELVCCI